MALLILLTLFRIFRAFSVPSLSSAFAIAFCPFGFEKSTYLYLTWCERILFTIPSTSTQGARWGQYWRSPNNSMPKFIHNDFDIFVRWIDALSIFIVVILNLVSKHLSRYDLRIYMKIQKSSVVVILIIPIQIQ